MFETRIKEGFQSKILVQSLNGDWLLYIIFLMNFTRGINHGVDGVVTTTPDVRAGWSWGGCGVVAKYYYILIISYNVLEYEMKTHFKQGL